MIVFTPIGGLGNQLFQIFAIIAHGIENKIEFKFVYADQSGSVTPRKTYWNDFLSSIKFFTVYPHNVPPNLAVVKYPQFHHVPLVVHNSTVNITYHGYFQSWKYFDHRKEDLFRMIKLKDHKDGVMQKLNNPCMNNTIAMHFRLGDYKHLDHTHPVMIPSYYANALTYILSKVPPKKYTVYYFHEKEDRAELDDRFISVLSAMMPSLTFVSVADMDLEDWEEMMFMSQCQHNIIANSSFSWFGAYFNDNKDKIVCHPSKWFNGEAEEKNRLDDLCPPSWIKIA